MSSASDAGTFLVAPRGNVQNLWLSIYVAILIGKFGEWIPGLASVPLAKLAFLLTVVFTFRARKNLPTVVVRNLPIAWPGIYFLALALISVVFSVYKGKSVMESYSVAITLLSLILLLKVTQTIADLERIFFALTVAAAGLALATIFSYAGGRAQINGNFDPNDLAYGLVTILPIIRALAVTATKHIQSQILNGLAAATVGAVLLTGSRGGVVAIALEVLLIVAFPLSFAKGGGLKRFHPLRFIVTIGLVVGLILAMWGYVPMEIRQRVATLVELQDDYNMTSAKDGRSGIWTRDVAAVWERPIGYGLGTSEYVNGITGGHYRAPHNSFIQALVEEGALGGVLLSLGYLVALVQLGKVTGRGGPARAPPNPKALLYARALRVSVAANLVAGFFLSHAYDALLWIVIGICATLVRIDRTPAVRKPPAAAI